MVHEVVAGVEPLVWRQAPRPFSALTNNERLRHVMLDPGMDFALTVENAGDEHLEIGFAVFGRVVRLPSRP